MKILNRLQHRIVVIVVIIALVRFAFIFNFLPIFNDSLSSFYTSKVLRMDLIFIILLIILIYLFSKNLNEKLLQEQNITKENINRYEALSIATNDAIWDHDLTTGVTFYNNRLIEMFGYTQKDLLNNKTWWMDNIHDNDKTEVVKKMAARLISTHNLWLDEYRFRCKNGDYKIVRDRSFIVRNANNVPTRLIGAMNDITAEKAIQEKYLQEKLNNKNRLGKAIIQTQEEERKNIRYELHEDVNQILAAVKMTIQQNTKGMDADDSRIKSVENLNEVIKKIRKISNQLSPGAMDYFGLISSINEIIIFNETNYSVRIKFNSDNFIEAETENGIRIFIYRIVQDLLSTLIDVNNSDELVINVSIESIGDKIELIFKHKITATNKNKLIKMRRFINIKNKLEMYNGTMKIYKNDEQEETLIILL